MFKNVIHTINKHLLLLKPVFWSIISIVLLLPVTISAEIGGGGQGGDTAGSGGTQFVNPLGAEKNSITVFLADIIDIVLTIAIPIAVMSIIFAGLKMVMARGNETELSKAKELLKWTLIGTAVLIGSKVLVGAVQGTLSNIGVGDAVAN